MTPEDGTVRIDGDFDVDVDVAGITDVLDVEFLH